MPQTKTARKADRLSLDYYKFAFIVAGILLHILFYIISGHSLHKDSILYIAMVNFAPGEEMTQNLTDGFLEKRY